MVADDNNDQQVAVNAGKWGVRLKGTSTIIIIVLLASMAGVLFFTWNGFGSIDLQHKEQVNEMRIQSYILAECLRDKGGCPNLIPPPGLADRVYRKRSERER